MYKGKYTGFYRDFADSTVQKICHYNNGRLNGPFYGYYPSGSIMIKCDYKDDEIDGEFIKYHDSGTRNDTVIMEKRLFLPAEMRDGKWQFFYPVGSLYMAGNYNRGRFEGNWVIYYPDGTLKQEGNFCRRFQLKVFLRCTTKTES
jgi:uncharacterized protein